jgi:hypothetical protein
MYKVVQIWPGQTVTCLHTISPGHIWTTLYIQNDLRQQFANFPKIYAASTNSRIMWGNILTYNPQILDDTLKYFVAHETWCAGPV